MASREDSVQVKTDWEDLCKVLSLAHIHFLGTVSFSNSSGPTSHLSSLFHCSGIELYACAYSDIAQQSGQDCEMGN